MKVVLLCIMSMIAAPPAEEHARWDALLKKTVKDEKVDYVAFRDKHRDELRAYLDSLADLDPQTLSRDQRLALYINAYNATTIELVIERYRPDFSPMEAKGKIWDEQRVRIGGKRITLNELEHEILRKQFDDPRIHAALVCAAISCPPLSDEAYTAQKIDQQLDRAMRAWLHDPKRNVIDMQNKKLRLSKIFRWYAQDFGGEEKLAEYVAQYTTPRVKEFEVSFLQYDWRLNDLSNAGRTD